MSDLTSSALGSASPSSGAFGLAKPFQQVMDELQTDHSTHRQRIEQAITFFERQGWSRAQSIGIVANLDAESGLDPAVRQHRGGPAYGLAQWEYPRQQDFRAWAGYDIHRSTFEEQLRFVQHELTNSVAPAGNALRRTTTAESASRVVTLLYERPKDLEGEATRRAAAAAALEFGSDH